MASDNLNQVGKYMKSAHRKADLALKRYRKKLPVKDRVRDNISSVNSFIMNVETTGDDNVTIDINFLNPPPTDCASNCIATSCQDFELGYGGYSLTVANPYEPGTVRVYNNGEDLTEIQWYEENPSGGQVYVQVQGVSETIVVCYSYVVC